MVMYTSTCMTIYLYHDVEDKITVFQCIHIHVCMSRYLLVSKMKVGMGLLYVTRNESFGVRRKSWSKLESFRRSMF